jgi:hypothetical protein
MREQNYKNHRRVVPMFHLVTFLAIIAAIIGSFVNLYESRNNHDNLYSASLICLITLILGSLFTFVRLFPLRAQDRAIRAEESLRHFVLTGKLPDSRLRMSQIIALRFASDEELPALSKRAAEENLSSTAIKKSIKNWRPDFHRA